jgi:hypothetical protein
MQELAAQRLSFEAGRIDLVSFPPTLPSHLASGAHNAHILICSHAYILMIAFAHFRI